MIEEWKDVVGYENIYEVSNQGLVRTKLGKTTYTEHHGIRHWGQRILKQKISKDKNHRVSLYKDGIVTTCLVHRIVAFAFIPTIDEKVFINHMDGNRDHNYISNLEWCNPTENNNHAFNTGLIKTGKMVSLTNLKTGETTKFRSQAKASQFLGRGCSYVGEKIRKNQFIVDGYVITEL